MLPLHTMILSGQTSFQIAQTNVKRVKKYRDAAATRLKVGEITKTVLLRAEAELSGAQSEQIRTDNNWQLARAILSRIASKESIS